ncbi:flagellar type III secretion system pore protein FliP [Leifsonia shinshuensis]|uniref:Flagellar biosynthetic protein FliP n=1 Tax=Leifsonia shinshuensis TaxID=150026 RepID=A0A7G6YCR0_9MICO|nr:flagellar type III secretion system pore protein FliP [Leifsonia shinshuensis]QNE36275.1 flagellar type III secretion system pore protein FliP [Leifsonia shinshuensis]
MSTAALAGTRRSYARPIVLALLVLAAVIGIVLLTAGSAHAVPTPSPTPPAGPSGPTGGSGGATIAINGINGTPADTIVTLLGVTLISVAPGLLVMVSSFTKVFVVLSMARNALGLQSVPPNQVLAGLALFLSLFIMAPTLTDINVHAVQPYLAGHLDFGGALQAAEAPLKAFLGAHTRQEDIALMTRAAGRANPANLHAVPLTTLVPAFVISELRAAFIIGFVIYVPFLVIDLVVSAGLMSLGMMMLPPVMVSLPFKILLFVLVDGWGLIIQSLVASYK